MIYSAVEHKSVIHFLGGFDYGNFHFRFFFLTHEKTFFPSS